MGQIVGYRNLQNVCKVCNKRADWDVTILEEDTPRTIGGERVLGYCNEHLPDSVKVDIKSWYRTAQTPPRQG